MTILDISDLLASAYIMYFIYKKVSITVNVHSQSAGFYFKLIHNNFVLFRFRKAVILFFGRAYNFIHELISNGRWKSVLKTNIS